MAFLKLNDEFLVLGEKRLALYDGYAARLSVSGGGSGSRQKPPASGAIQGDGASGKVTTDTASGKVQR